jgi:hypothetical protein
MAEGAELVDVLDDYEGEECGQTEELTTRLHSLVHE